MLQIKAYQVCKTAEIEGCIPGILVKYHFFDTFERIENKVRIHLCMQCFHLIFGHLPVKAHPFAQPADTVPVEIPCCTYQYDDPPADKPPGSPKGRLDNDPQFPDLFRPPVVGRKKFQGYTVFSRSQVAEIHAMLPVQQVPGSIGGRHNAIGKPVVFRASEIYRVKSIWTELSV